MAQQHFGTRLAEARRKRGLTLEQVHKQLRITPAIIESLEMADYKHMPFKGHSRNMVSAYARYLGLDSEEITKQFLREYHEYEGVASRTPSAISLSHAVPDGGSAQTSTVRSGTVSARNSSRHIDIGLQDVDNQYVSSSDNLMNSKVSQGVSSMWNKNIPGSDLNHDYDNRYSSSAPSSKRPVVNTRRRVQTRDGNRSESSYQSGGYKNSQSLPLRLFGTLISRPIALVVVLVIVLILLFVIWALAANSCKKADDTNPVSPTIVGNTDGTATDGTNTDATQGETPAANSFEITITPASGAGPWTEVIVDGQTVFEEGYFTEAKTWTVTASIQMWTSQPENLTVTKNGEKVEWVRNTELAIGELDLKVEVVTQGGTTTGQTTNEPAT